MKHKYLYSILITMSALLFAACNNAEYKTIDNSLYFVDAAGTDKISTVPIENGVDISIGVRLAQKMTEDIEVELLFNPELLTMYNTENGTEYVNLPEEMLPQDITITIPAGEIGGVYNLHIDNFETYGTTYAIPVQLGKIVKGTIEKSDVQSKFIYLLSEPLITSVPVMKGSKNPPGAIKAAPFENWNLQLSQWTVECWVRMNGFQYTNQGFIRVGDSKTFPLYARYGDANKPYNYLQVKAFGGGSGGQVNTDSDLNPKEWYHWTFVWDGSTLTIYRNGEKEMTSNPIDNGVPFNSFFMVLGDVKNECSMSQVRLWNVARSQDEIKNNMFNRINPQNTKLVAYWPMDELDKNGLLKDITGNGHDATVPTGLIQRWEHNVRFDKK